MEEPPPPIPDQPGNPPAPTMSLGARLMNVFAIPGDVFAEVRLAAASPANWLVPALLTAFFMAITSAVIMSQPAIKQKVKEQQQRTFDKMVESGKITREQADKQLEMIEKFSGPTMMVVGGTISGVVYGFGRVLWWAFFLWMLGRFLLKQRFRFGKAMEASGLAGMIGVLGLIVTMLLQVNFSDMSSSPSLALLVDKFDETNPGHVVLATVNVFYIWQALVLAVALARLSDVPFGRAAFVFLPFWLIFELTMVGLTFSLRGLMG
jgi:hypothetical protein